MAFYVPSAQVSERVLESRSEWYDKQAVVSERRQQVCVLGPDVLPDCLSLMILPAVPGKPRRTE